MRSKTTHAEETDEIEQSARAEAAEAADDDAEATSDAAKSGGAVLEAWRDKGFRFSVITAALITAAMLSFGVGRVLGLGNTEVLSAIPTPQVPVNDLFVEDQDGFAEDNRSNIIASTGQGIVHVLSGRTSVGIGLVLTQSGKVLTTYQPSAGAANLVMDYVFSGQTFKAKVIGVDRAAGLALLQMEGGDGRPFSTVTVGNSDTVVSNAAAIRENTYHVRGQVIDTAVSTTGSAAGVSLDVGNLTTLNTTVTLGQITWTGLMASALASSQPPAIGSPLVNPNGHVIGVIVGSSGRGSNALSYAVPINWVLSVATKIDNANS